MLLKIVPSIVFILFALFNFYCFFNFFIFELFFNGLVVALGKLNA